LHGYRIGRQEIKGMGFREIHGPGIRLRE
ncbi:MAG: hypothetical protein H6R29_158, partial [Methanomicrobia archaeon]|nr:hypothetical protein [Methanomicrobia archaeon]